MPVIDIRGTHGSGKSHLVHKIIEAAQYFPDSVGDIIEENVSVGHYCDPYDLAIVGRYDRVCGGCDGIKEADEVVRRVKTFSQSWPNVILEGILVAHTFKRYSVLANHMNLMGIEYIFCFLDTPLDVCIARVKQRRAERGDTKPFDPKNVIKDWNTVWCKMPGKCRHAGHKVVILDHKNPLPQVLELMS